MASTERQRAMGCQHRPALLDECRACLAGYLICESVPPEQPIAPMILPCSTNGIPPRDAMNRSGFFAQPKVDDRASELLREVFGEAKLPVRMVLGVASLPLVVEVLFEVET